MTAPKNNEIENKPKMSTIPLDLIGIFLPPAYEEGFIKYWRESWRKGFTTTNMADALLRHFSAYMYKKEDYDPETLEKYGIKKHHLGAMLFCVLCLCDTFENHPELDDRHKDWKKEKEDLNQIFHNSEPFWKSKLCVSTKKDTKITGGNYQNNTIKEHINSMIAVANAFKESGISLRKFKNKKHKRRKN